MSYTRILPFGVFAVSVFTNSVFGTLVVEDTFDEPVSSAPPTNWVEVGTGSDHASVVEGSLTYPGLAESTGNRFGLGQGTASYRFDFTPTAVGDNEHIYYSFLLRLDSPIDAFNAGVFVLANSANATSGNLRVGWGTTDFSTNLMGFSLSDRNRGFNSSESGDLVKTAETYTAADTTYLIVAGYNRGTDAASSSVSLWVNPTNLGGATPPTETLFLQNIASFTHGDMALWDTLTWSSNGSGSGVPEWSVDELRIGTEWADVTPAIPEPTTVGAVLGLSSLALVLLRRRKKQ